MTTTKAAFGCINKLSIVRRKKMAILWSDDLATGVAVIDSQHQELFIRIGNLLDACSQGKGRDEVKRTIKFLEDYVVTHFKAEETHMITTAYPAYGDHKKQHIEFMENFEKLKNQFETTGPGLTTVITTNHLVVDWLKTHIRKVDKALGDHLKAGSSGGPGAIAHPAGDNR